MGACSCCSLSLRLGIEVTRTGRGVPAEVLVAASFVAAHALGIMDQIVERYRRSYPALVGYMEANIPDFLSVREGGAKKWRN